MFGLIENITTKGTAQDAACLLSAMFETCVEKVDAVAMALGNAFERAEMVKRGEEGQMLALLIEKSRPVAATVYAVEKPEDVIHGKWVCVLTRL